MTEVLFAFDKCNYRDCQNAYRGTEKQEFYLGDYTIEAGSVIDARADRRTVAAYSIVRVRSKTRMSFRRSLAHIREDAVDVAVLWFVKSGHLTISHQSGTTIAHAGDFVITKSITPFFVECEVASDAGYETLQIVVPNHVLRRFFPDDLKTGFCVTARGGKFTIAEHILTDLFQVGGDVPEPIAQLLVESALHVLSAATRREHSAGSNARQSVSDKRMQDVLRFIENHLSDPRLNVAAVAQGCGISSRYLFFLLKERNISFSRLMWEKRLAVARHWLASADSDETAISEIAYKVGFKSSEHFSRMFKRTFNVSPRQFRNAAINSRRSADCVADEIEALH